MKKVSMLAVFGFLMFLAWLACVRPVKSQAPTFPSLTGYYPWFAETSQPPTPNTGFIVPWASSTDHRMHDLNSSGVNGTSVIPGTCTNQFFSILSTAGVLTCSPPQPYGLGNGTTVIDVSTKTGADFCAQLNAAYAALPSVGGKIIGPGGNYSCTTPVVFATNSKPVLLECVPGHSFAASPTGATHITFTPTSGVAVTFGVAASGMTGCTLSGSGGTSTGLLVGGGAVYDYFVNNDISGFGTGGGISFGNDTYVDSFYDNSVHDNGITGGAVTANLVVPASLADFGENISFYGGSFWGKQTGFSTSCLNVLSGVELRFNSVSFDQCGMTLNAPGVIATFDPPHFENPNGATAADFLTIGPSCSNCAVYSIGGEWLEDIASSGRTEFISIAGSRTHIALFGGIYYAAETVAQIINSSAGSAEAGYWEPDARNFTNITGGDYGVYTSGAVGGNFVTGGGTFSSSISVKGQVNQNASNYFAGNCSMTGGTTCTASIYNGYNSSPICIVTIQGGTTLSGGTPACSVSGTTVTITAPASNSLTWGFVLIGNPN